MKQLSKTAVLTLLLLLCLATGAQQHKTVLPKTGLIARPMASGGGSCTLSVCNTVNFAWQEAAYPSCPATSPANCISGFVLTDTTTNTVLAGGASTTPLGPTTHSFAWTPAGGLYYGTHTFSLVATGYDGSGAPTQSPAATTMFTNNLSTLAAPTGFSTTGN